MAIRSLSGGCKDYMAAFALIPWVTDPLWLRSQSFHGLHLHDGLRSHNCFGLHCLCGWRVRTHSVGYRADWLPFALFYWGADNSWLGRSHLVGCNYLLAAFAQYFGLQSFNGLVAQSSGVPGDTGLLRTSATGCRQIMADRSLSMDCRHVVAAGSHSHYGEHVFYGCRVRISWMGCKGTMAAGFAPFHWVTRENWLRSHCVYGFLCFYGWRFARFGWAAATTWLGRTSFVGCRVTMADFALGGGLQSIMAVSQLAYGFHVMIGLCSQLFFGVHY